MKTIGKLISFILVIGLLVAIGWAILLGVKYIAGQFNLLSTELTSSMIIVLALFLICTLILASAINESKFKGDKPVHPEKSFIYTDFINYFLELKHSLINKEEITYWFRSDITLWAGKDVLRSYLLLNQYLDKPNADNSKILEQAEKVIFEMRKDLGQKNYGIKPGDLEKLMFPFVKEEVSPLGNTRTKTK